MERRKKTGVLSRGLIITLLFLILFQPRNIAQDLYEGYYLYLGEYPVNGRAGWHAEAQGLTHDNSHWFITQRDALWKVPVNQDLDAFLLIAAPGVQRVSLRNIPQLATAGYDHFGDPSYYAFDGQGYILIPIEGGPPGLAVFRADTLQYVDHATFAVQTHAPWVAVDPRGNVYSSNDDDVVAVNKYLINWNALRNGQNLILSIAPPVPLFDEAGSQIRLQHVQGGVISPGGQLLYIVADGIHVFDLSTGKRLQRSTSGSGYFNYEFHPGFPKYEEPEGITIWDLDDGRAPNIRGQLHVIMLDNELSDSDDSIYLKHYTHTIYVHRDGRPFFDSQGLRAYMDVRGTPWRPFNTVGEANNLAWDGARIKIKAGSYPEMLTISKRVKVIAEGGTTTIGQ
ncbi:MAG: hypothetical protein D6723_03650 [Acidobacteria bacterium]|nr:MAG: hypothetical protein D6723_03650 [Acidobacteriota bacterium]